MTPSRKDVLKLAAASIAGAGGAPFAVSPEQAAALLAEAATVDPGPGRCRIGEPNHLDLVQFAESIDGTDWPFGDALAHGAPAEMAAYKQAHLGLLDLAPGLLGDGTPGGDALNAMDEAALALWCGAWMAGVRAGAAYEHLRLAMIAQTSVCDRCHGGGRLWSGTPYRSHGGEEAECADCGGRGTVPTPAPRL